LFFHLARYKYKNSDPNEDEYRNPFLLTDRHVDNLLLLINEIVYFKNGRSLCRWSPDDEWTVES
jgi:hypothetical protein